MVDYMEEKMGSWAQENRDDYVFISHGDSLEDAEYVRDQIKERFTGENRNQLVLMMVIDMAVYHIFCIHNPQKLSKVRKDRYERAVEWMKAVADEDISIEGAPLLPEEQRAGRSDFRIQSNRKRTNHW